MKHREPTMPVTGKLSKLFYERLGDQVANELVDWFNRVDEANRADLRELNELNFARFEAKLALMATRADLAEAKAELRVEIGDLRSSVKTDIAGLREVLERRLGEQSRWMVGAWAALMVPMIGMLVAMWSVALRIK